jgi:hypothetical protein
MKLLRKIRITAVRERSVVVPRLGPAATASCVECPEGGLMVTPIWAATVSGQSLRTVFLRIEAGEIHYTDGPEGILICVESLANPRS